MKIQVHQQGRRGFSLIELMVVLVILGILAATIIPQVLGTKEEAKVGAAKAHVSELESALERFNVHMDRFPTTEEGLKVLVEAPANETTKWRGPYINILRPDPWNNPYQYANPGVRNPSRFDLWSRGKDAADGGEGDAADIGNWQ
jgi:general secretion pathway protein G